MLAKDRQRNGMEWNGMEWNGVQWRKETIIYPELLAFSLRMFQAVKLTIKRTPPQSLQSVQFKSLIGDVPLASLQSKVTIEAWGQITPVSKEWHAKLPNPIFVATEADEHPGSSPGKHQKWVVVSTCSTHPKSYAKSDTHSRYSQSDHDSRKYGIFSLNSLNRFRSFGLPCSQLLFRICSESWPERSWPITSGKPSSPHDSHRFTKCCQLCATTSCLESWFAITIMFSHMPNIR